MKKIFILFAVAFIGFASCVESKQVMTVTVTNPLGLERAGEMIEVPMSDVVAKLKLADTAQIVVLDIDGQQVPYQVTYDEKVVFPVTVKANGTATYTIQPGTPEPFNVIACGKYYSERLKENNNPDSRVVFSDEAQGTIAGVGEEWITFYSSALSLDRTWVNYQITVTCKPGSCLVELEKIRFTYRETEKYKAEEWITDEYALNKAKTKLVRGLAKWRRKTVDFADDIFMDVAVAFGAPDTRPKSEKKKKEEEAQKPSIVAAAGPLVIGQGGKVTTAEADQTTTPAATLTPATPVGKASADMPGYTEIDLKQIPGDVYALMGNGKLVISIGKDEFNMTNMTANAGGALGYQNGKAVAYCTLSADQPYEAIEKAETYTLKLYAPNQTTPSAVIECKKLPSQTTPQAGQPRTYVGEIVKLLMKK